MTKVKKIVTWSAFPSLLLFIVFLGVNAAITGGLSTSFFYSFFATNSAAICVAIGVTATILVAGTDISLGSIVSLVNVVIVTLCEKGYTVWSAALIALACAILCGMFNGFVIGVLRVNPLLTTFATCRYRSVDTSKPGRIYRLYFQRLVQQQAAGNHSYAGAFDSGVDYYLVFHNENA